LLIKRFYTLGDVKGSYGTTAKLTAIVVFEPGKESERLRGLGIEVKQGSGYLSRSHTSFLDLEEVEGLNTTIAYMLDVGTQWKSTNKDNAEVVFQTKDEFKIGFGQNSPSFKKEELLGFVSSGLGNESASLFPIEALGSIKGLVESGLTMLNQK